MFSRTQKGLPPESAQEPPQENAEVEQDPRRSRALWVILALQAGWLALIMLRGWYSGPDIGNLAEATGQPLSGHYLSQSLGGHFGAPGRLVFWVLNRVAPLSWGLTVVLRLLLQAAGTFLLWRLLEELVGRRKGLPAVVALYAFSPLLVPATAVFTNVLGLAIGQVCVLGALLAHVRYTRTGRLRHGLTAAVLSVTAVVFADQAVLGLFLLPLLSLGFLHQGTPRQRLAQARGRWPGWAALGLLLVGFAVLYLSAGDSPGRPKSFSIGDALFIVQDEWLNVLGTSLVGGPWHWTTHPAEWVSYADAPVVAIVLGQLALVGLVVASIRRTGLRALLAWAAPVGISLGGALLVGYGRSDYLGTYIAPIYRYSYYTAMGLALGVVLAFVRTPEERAAHPWEEQPVRAPRLAVGGGLAALLLASLVSGLTFAGRFWDNPAKEYFSTLAASARALGPQTEIYDSVVPNGVIPPVAPNHFVSDALGLLGVRAAFGGGAPTPLIASPEGRLVASGFVPAADVTSPTTTTCGTFVHGAGRTTVQLGALPSINDWFLQLQIYQPHANNVTLEAREADGSLLPLASGSPTFETTGSLVAVNRRFAPGRPVSLTLITSDSTANFCLVHAFVGAPFPKKDS
jgi:hypothetical protein